MSAPAKKRSRFTSVFIIVILICVLCAVVSAINRALNPAQPTTVAQSQPTSAPASGTPLATQAAYNTAGPTATQGPSETPAPTATPAPTDTPAPTVTPTPPPAPITLTGTHQDVTSTIAVTVPSRMHATYKGTGNFAVWAFNDAGGKDLLINNIDAYEGYRALLPGTYYFQIDAETTWTLVIEPLVPQPDAAALSGHGDFVSGLFIPAAGNVPYTFTHDGKANFAVWLYCGDNRDLLQNEVGSVNNTAVVQFDGSTCFWQIDADGNWTVKPRQ